MDRARQPLHSRGVQQAQTLVDAWSWPEAVELAPARNGNINRTFLVRSAIGPLAVLQRLNTSIFDPVVHLDIEAVTGHLEARGMATPRLRRTREGSLWHEVDGEIWRVLTWVGDETIQKVRSSADAWSAGHLVARFHDATHDLTWQFRSVRGGFHDTDQRMAQLRAALGGHRDHPYRARVEPLAERILRAWERWEGPRDLPLRVVHGDLKISNIRFARGRAEALIDLDTLGQGTLDAELGDALRSWCNPAQEDEPAQFAVDLLEASLRGYAQAVPDLAAEEWTGIVPGVERIALELASRFATDALEERYFRFDASRYSRPADHHLVRAEQQERLASAVRAQRARSETIVRSVRGS